jgi:hypothetical protein
MVRVEQLNGQYGQVEFETLLQFAVQQYYQFVYVTSSGVVLGVLTPFRVGGEQQPELEQLVIKGGKYMPTTTGAEWFTGFNHPNWPIIRRWFVCREQQRNAENAKQDLQLGVGRVVAATAVTTRKPTGSSPIRLNQVERSAQ